MATKKKPPTADVEAKPFEVDPHARYGPEEVDKGLIALALASGRAEDAVKY
jgi:hypothetical protein